MDPLVGSSVFFSPGSQGERGGGVGGKTVKGRRRQGDKA